MVEKSDNMVENGLVETQPQVKKIGQLGRKRTCVNAASEFAACEIREVAVNVNSVRCAQKKPLSMSRSDVDERNDDADKFRMKFSIYCFNMRY